AASRVGAVALVDVHEVDVGAVVELAAAELAHAEDDESPRPFAGPIVAPLGRETRARRVRRGVYDRLGERGELAHRLLDRRETEERRHETARRRARCRLDEARERRQGIGRVGRGVESRAYLVRGRGVDPRARGACLQPGEQSCGIRHRGARKSTGTPAASSRSRRYPWRTPWSLTVTALARAAATTRSRTT